MLALADILFTLLHIVVTLFNLLGWIWHATRKYHLGLIGITAFSWLILGIWYGWGYCPLTDWHWQVKRQLGESHLPISFIDYILIHYFNLHVDSGIVARYTGITFALVTALSLFTNIRDWRKKRAKT